MATETVRAAKRSLSFFTRPTMSNLAGGSYLGDLVGGKFEGQGEYTTTTTKYRGNFANGHFNGEGTLEVKGGRFEGVWANGKLISGGFIFDDDLPYKTVDQTNWKYCSPEDPRFYEEIKMGIQLGEDLILETPDGNKQELAIGCYDVIDGYYDSKKLSVYSYKTKDIIRMPDKEEREWIIKNCRKSEY